MRQARIFYPPQATKGKKTKRQEIAFLPLTVGITGENKCNDSVNLQLLLDVSYQITSTVLPFNDMLLISVSLFCYLFVLSHFRLTFHYALSRVFQQFREVVELGLKPTNHFVFLGQLFFKATYSLLKQLDVVVYV